MNHHEQEQLRTRLINAGFWDASALYDPTKNWVALEELSERVQQLLAEPVSLFVYPINSGRQAYQVTLSYKEDKDFVNVFSQTNNEIFLFLVAESYLIGLSAAIDGVNK